MAAIIIFEEKCLPEETLADISEPKVPPNFNRHNLRKFYFQTS